MTELRTTHWTDNAILNAAMRNAAERAGVAEIQDMMMRLLFGDDLPAAGEGGVMGGLVCDNVTGQLQSTVTPGWGWYYDSAIAAPRSKFGVVLLKETATVNHSAGDATNARYDIITIECPMGTDTETSVPFWQAAPQNIDIQRGAQPAVTVTKGVEDGSLAVPATPAGHLLLAVVYVPALASNLNAAVYTDSRKVRGVAQRDGDTNPVLYRGRDAGTNAKIFEVTTIADVIAGLASAMRWRASEDWPAFQRSIALAGEKTGTAASDWLYPMMIPGGRTWWRTVPWSATPTVAENDTKINIVRETLTGRLKLEVQNDQTWAQTLHLPIHCEARGLELVGAKVRYQATTPIQAMVDASTCTLQVAKADGTYTALGSLTLDMSNADAAPVTTAFTLSATPVLAEGEYIIATYTIDHQGDDTGQSDVYLDSILLQFREGRTS